jgi:hypothetical protein
MMVCDFTWGDGHICDQLLARGHRGGGLLRPPKGFHYGKPDADGVYPLRRNRTPRRGLPPEDQPKDEYDQPMWPTQRWGVPTGQVVKQTIGETVYGPADVRCPACGQKRHIG